MKMIYCTYNVSVSEEIQKILDKLKIQNYQIFENILAKSGEAAPRFNTPVWPGYNNSLLVQMESERLVMDYINSIQDYNLSTDDKNEVISCYSWEIKNH